MFILSYILHARFYIELLTLFNISSLFENNNTEMLGIKLDSLTKVVLLIFDRVSLMYIKKLDGYFFLLKLTLSLVSVAL